MTTRESRLHNLVDTTNNIGGKRDERRLRRLIVLFSDVPLCTVRDFNPDSLADKVVREVPQMHHVNHHRSLLHFSLGQVYDVTGKSVEAVASQKIEFVFSASPETIHGSLGSLISFAQSPNAGPGSLRAVGILLSFSPRGQQFKPLLCCVLLQVRSLVVGDPRLADTKPSSELRLGLRDWHCPSAFLFHGSKPARDSVWAPAWPPPPIHAEYVCCAVWKAVSAGPCLRNSFLLRTAHSN
jgi:hypothetical protein